MSTTVERILVTGASRGIGRAAALRLAARRQPCELLLSGTDEAALRDAASECERFPSVRAVVMPCDLSDRDRLREFCSTLRGLPSLSAVVNNAGVGRFGPTGGFASEEWDRLVSVNLTAAFEICRAAIEPLLRAPAPRTIVNVSSDADHLGFSEAAAYCASKSGLAGMSRALALELQPRGIRVTTLSPGRVDTFFNGKRPGMRPGALSAEDVAEVVVFLCTCSPNIEVQELRLESMARPRSG